MAFLGFSPNQDLFCDVCWNLLACLKRTHEIEHHWPLHYWISDHLPPLFAYQTQGAHDVVARLNQRFGMVILVQHAELFDVRFKEELFSIALVKAVEQVHQDG